MVPGDEFRRQGLVGKAHVHDRRGVAFGRGQVDQTAFRQDIEAGAVLQGKFLHRLPDMTPGGADALQGRDVDFDVEVPGIGEDGAVFHADEMLLPDDIDVAGEGAEDIPDFCGLGHGEDFVAVHQGF